MEVASEEYWARIWGFSERDRDSRAVIGEPRARTHGSPSNDQPFRKSGNLRHTYTPICELLVKQYPIKTWFRVLKIKNHPANGNPTPHHITAIPSGPVLRNKGILRTWLHATAYSPSHPVAGSLNNAYERNCLF